MLKNRMVRGLLALALLFWLRSKAVKFAASIRRQLHKRRLLQALPGPPCKKGLLGSVHVMVPEGVTPSRETVRLHMMNQMLKLLRQKKYKDEGLLRFWQINDSIPIHGRGVIFVTKQDTAREILSTKHKDSWIKGRSYTVSRPLIGHGVLATSGEEWARQRPLLDKFFKADIIDKNIPRILKTAREFTDKTKAQISAADRQDGILVDIHEEFLKVTLDVLGRVAFSYDIGSTTAPTTAEAPLYNAFDNIINTIVMRIRNPFLQMTRNWPLQQNRRFDASLNKLKSVVYKIIDDRLNADGQGSEERTTDLLDILLAGPTEEEEKKWKAGKMSRELMVDNIQTMLFAGHDTTAAACTWFLRILADHPETQRKLRAEAAEYLGDLETSPSLAILDSMPFLNNVVLEVLRLYPSAGYTRRAKHDIKVSKYVIPAHTEVLFFPYFIQRDENEFKNPDDFIPERWEQKTGNEKLTLQAQLARETRAKAFLPFSLGKRNCVGRTLALVEIRLIILQILYEFDIKLPTPEQLETVQGPAYQPWPTVTLTLNPEGVRLALVPRNGFTE